MINAFWRSGLRRRRTLGARPPRWSSRDTLMAVIVLAALTAAAWLSFHAA